MPFRRQFEFVTQISDEEKNNCIERIIFRSNSVLAPEAVLEDENNSEKDARDESGGTEAGK